jgi:vWA-MoxR associated protein C-terminal domain
MTSPERTYAVVVGIERYEAGDRWDLDGAAGSALRIIRWLRKRHVPAENITVLLSPLDGNRSTVQQTLGELEFPSEPLSATVDEIRRVITEELPAKDGDLLVLFWSGHGVLDRRKERRLFCANAAVNAKYNINVTDLLAALSGKNFAGLREQVIIVDACANFIQEMRLKLQEPESGFAIGAARPVRQEALLAAAQGERASLDQKASSGTFARIVTDWLDENAATLPPPTDQLAAAVVARFEELREQGVTAQHPVRIREILHASDAAEHVFGGEPVPESAWRAARLARLTTDQLRTTAATIAATPQLATQRGRDALFAALQSVVGAVARTDDPDADLLELVSAVLDRQALAALFRALLDLAANEEERIAAVAVRHRLELQSAVVPLLGMLQRTPWIHVLGALAETVCQVPADTSDLDKALELLADLRTSRSGAPPLAEFVVRLQERRPDLQMPAGWFSDQGLDEVAVAALRSSVADETGMRRKLVIDLRESAPNAWQAAVTGYLGPGWCTQTVKCEPKADGVRGAVLKIVEWARSQAGDLAIGFLLGYNMLRELPEQWKYEDVVIAPIRLCEEHPVVLHVAERMTIPQLQRVWDSKLAAIEASGGAPSVLWLDQDDAAAIRRVVQKSDDAYVAFTFVPEARLDPRTTAVMAAIAAGAPYIVWVQAAPADNYGLCERLGQMLGPIRDFPATLRQRRAADPYMSDALRVIWDDPDELPPYLERLGEELVSNG